MDKYRWQITRQCLAGAYKLRSALCLFLTGILLSALSAGCAGGGLQEKLQDSVKAPESLRDKAEFDYETPESLPGILVNQVGYLTESNKMAVFRGPQLPAHFEIQSMDTGETVYTGFIEPQGYNEIIEEYNSYGNFTDFNTPGTYMIKADIVGQSYPFRIGNDLYDEIFDKACRQYYLNRCGITLTTEYAGEAAHNACHTKMASLRDSGGQIDVSGGWHLDENFNKDVVKGCQAAANMLLAYELYEQSFDDALGIPESGNSIPDLLDEIRYEVEWLLKMQDDKTGGVYGSVTMGESDRPTATAAQNSAVEPVTIQATASFSAILAKFSYLYQDYDTAYATRCLQAADRAWKYLDKNRQTADTRWRFFAAAELYRATGSAVYHNEVKEYLRTSGIEESDSDPVFWGYVTYISTKQPVDVELCGRVIDKLMEKAEDIAENSKSYYYLTAGSKKQDNISALLHGIMRLVVVEHIITNHEYETVIENHLHYFLGRNPRAISYIDGAGSRSYKDDELKFGIVNQPDLDGEFIFMLSGLV